MKYPTYLTYQMDLGVLPHRKYRCCPSYRRCLHQKCQKYRNCLTNRKCQYRKYPKYQKVLTFQRSQSCQRDLTSQKYRIPKSLKTQKIRCFLKYLPRHRQCQRCQKYLTYRTYRRPFHHLHQEQFLKF
jgi:hypothetical protein